MRLYKKIRVDRTTETHGVGIEILRFTSTQASRVPAGGRISGPRVHRSR